MTYIFYHHLYIGLAEQYKIQDVILQHKWDDFMQFYNWYQLNPLNNPEGWTFFPEISQEDFYKITNCECECG